MRKCNGFLLIEAIIGLTILVVFMGVFAFMQSKIYAIKSETIDYLQAQTNALNYAEKIKSGAISVGQEIKSEKYSIHSKIIPIPNINVMQNNFNLIEVIASWDNAKKQKRSCSVFTGKSS